MAKTILINGYGTGISHALAEKFAAQGFAVGLVARSSDRLAAGVQALESKGFVAAGFEADLQRVEDITELVQRVKKKLGPVHVVQWNAYASGAGDLLASKAGDLTAPLAIATTSLLAVVQAALADLRESKGAVLVTNGGLGLLDAQVDAGAVQWKASGLAIANAAKHKLVRLLAEQLRADGVYVGEVMVCSAVKGTAWDNGSSQLEASAIADKFWQLYSERRELSVQIG